jgi:hypothetical protein
VLESHPNETKKYFVIKSLVNSNQRSTRSRSQNNNIVENLALSCSSEEIAATTSLPSNKKASTNKKEKKGKKKATAVTLDLLCEKKLSKSSFWRNHEASSPSKKFKCQKCVQTFASREEVRQHVLDTNSPERQVVCQICQHRLESREDLSKHLGQDHVPRHLRCGLCREPTEYCLSNHIDYIFSSKEKNFDCVICDKTFNRMTALRNHTIE